MKKLLNLLLLTCFVKYLVILCLQRKEILVLVCNGPKFRTIGGFRHVGIRLMN